MSIKKKNESAKNLWLDGLIITEGLRRLSTDTEVFAAFYPAVIESRDTIL